MQFKDILYLIQLELIKIDFDFIYFRQRRARKKSWRIRRVTNRADPSLDTITTNYFALASRTRNRMRSQDAEVSSIITSSAWSNLYLSLSGAFYGAAAGISGIRAENYSKSARRYRSRACGAALIIASNLIGRLRRSSPV